MPPDPTFRRCSVDRFTNLISGQPERIKSYQRKRDEQICDGFVAGEATTFYASGQMETDNYITFTTALTSGN